MYEDADAWDDVNFPLPEPEPANAELWERLIHGECSRVAILSPAVGRGMLELYFPQTLGLPPLWCRPYSNPETLAAEAADLAANDRWIAEDEVWVRHFLPRAEAIVSVETTRIAVMATPARRTYVDAETVAQWIRRSRARRRRGREGEPPISALDLALAPTPVVGSRVMKPVSLAVAEEDYADKLIRVSTRGQVRALRKVRANS
ncbi:MAG TPA: hypothetical protein VGL02_19880 [Streptomyces sp.]